MKIRTLLICFKWRTKILDLQNNLMENMKLLVHFHVYYHDQVDYFIEKMSNINGCDWDLYVTMSEMNPETVGKLRQFKPSAVFIKIENLGYDVWPFIKLMKENDLESYDIVLKLHTKAFCVRHIRKKGRSVYGFRWRDELVNSLLGTKGNFTDILGLFLRDPKAGMVCSDWLYIKLSKGLPEDLSRLKNELDRIGLANVGNRFCAGTMFMARTSAYMFLKTAEISADMFDPESDSGMIGSVAHVYERILSMAPVAAGYSVKTVSTSRLFSIYTRIAGLLQPAAEQIFSISRIRENRDKYLTVRS